MKIGIIGASETEIEPIIKEIKMPIKKKKAMLTFIKGKIGNVKVVVVYSGVCKVNAAIASQIMIDTFGVTHLINVGVAGAIDHRLRICDTVVASKVAYHDVAAEVLTEYHPWMKDIYFYTSKEMLEGIQRANEGEATVYTGTMVTGERFIVESGRKRIMDTYHPLSVDMETGAIAHACYVNEIPFIAIRSISDTPKQKGTDVFVDNCKRASEQAIKVLLRYIQIFF